MSKSAQKYRNSSEQKPSDNCDNCKKLKEKCDAISKKLEETLQVLKT